MRALNRKALRDLAHLRGPALAIALVMAGGLGAFVAMLSTLHSLRETRDAYYDRQRFADVFAHLKRAPATLVPRLRALPGVAALEARIAEDVILDVPGLAEPATGRLISVPDRGRPALNDLHLRAGRWLEPGRTGEILCNEAFAVANGLRPGDALTALLNGRRTPLRIVGIVLSPEYVFQFRRGDLFPDDRRFGVFWMARADLAAAFDLEDAFNDVCLQVQPGASEADVIRRLDDRLAAYGGAGAYGREEQVSARYLMEEIRQLEGSGLVTPAIFLGVTAFLMHMVFARQLALQREQIAALKAFGYTGRELGAHYAKAAGAIVLIGAALGTALGAWLGRGMTRLYTQFYRFPAFDYALPPRVVLLGLLAGAGAAALGVAGAVRRAARLPPAVGLQPEPPRVYRPTVVERLGLQRAFSPAARMILRHLERTPVKAALTILGLALSAAILVAGNFSEDALDRMMEAQFYALDRSDVWLAFAEPRPPAAAADAARLPGIVRAEPFRAVSVTLRNGPRSERLALMGLPAAGDLFHPVDARLRPIPLPGDGLLLSSKLAERLAVRPGDEVTVEVTEGARPVRRAFVQGLVDDYAGLSAYMEKRALHRLLDETPCISGLFAQADPAEADRLYARIKDTPVIAGVTIKPAMLRSFRETFARNIGMMKVINALFASLIACGVVYNSARISLSERARELATLRVIGFSRGEAATVLLGELAALLVVALPLGMLLGYGFAVWISTAMETEFYRIPLVIRPATYAGAALVVVAAALASAALVRTRINRLDLVGVLKARE